MSVSQTLDRIVGGTRGGNARGALKVVVPRLERLEVLPVVRVDGVEELEEAECVAEGDGEDVRVLDAQPRAALVELYELKLVALRVLAKNLFHLLSVLLGLDDLVDDLDHKVGRDLFVGEAGPKVVVVVDGKAALVLLDDAVLFAADIGIGV